jgi:spore coat polysaccharide biosynthesis protein SpsF
MNNLFIIIQARMTSTRLPKKVLLPLCDKTILDVLIERLSKYKENIIIATTNDGTELPIVEFCKKNSIKYYQGSTDNVLERYFLSAKQHDAKENDLIVRITSDCPLIDVNVMEDVIDMYNNGNYDYVSNRLNRTVPVGLDVEVFNFSLLEYMYVNASLEYEKEHVTPFIYIANKDKYKLGSFEYNVDNSKYRLTLDENDDYTAIKEIYKKFDNKIDFSYQQLIDMLDNNTYIYDINKNVSQKVVVQ